MYLKMQLVNTVRVPPEFLGSDLNLVVKELLCESLEGRIDKKLGMIVVVIDLIELGEGKILAGDGGIYYESTFNALVYRPQLQEITKGRVVEIVNFGAFVEIGPMDGLVHVSQISDDFISYDEKNARLVCRESNRALSEGDGVVVRIVAVSLNESDPGESKIGLTMRQPTLGKFEWIEEEKRRSENE
ncbi:DNA-directed RNA polymerase [Methanosarcinales archaeon]|uniref:DNA-directed RNA polymerase subunit Rpo7 n=1 Tax=Candidatus Syntropharchaeum caldarium TaxID=1838285 RepID=A0A1F2PAW6_9EURY|nr:MAG: DNA-directed RNA polymerase subunit E' [Candidatus Syntrophoarchaeum caldarius]RLG35957.1 MAG: DNA-directed RNA polymerase [Methanosarcinales archaeon]